jgi:GntR family transcriptional regulator
MTFSNKPLYLQVRDALAERIASGGLRPGAAIPSEGDLAREIGVSAGTVRKALHLMDADRLIVRQQGRGTFVRDLRSNELAAAHFTRLHGANGARICGRVDAAKVSRDLPTQTERNLLQLADGADVYRIQRVWRDQGACFLVEDSALPAELFPKLEQKSEIADQIAVLAQEYGMLLGTVRERISTAVPPAAIAETLGTPPSLPVVVLDRVVLLLDRRRPVERRVAHYHLPGSYYLAEFR